MTLEGTAKQVFTDTFSNDKNHLVVTNRLLQVVGRGFVQTASIPFYFKWTNNLIQSWQSFNRTIESNGYLKYHSNSGPLLIVKAKQGFAKSELGKETLMAMRITSNDEEQNWNQFCKIVDKYLHARLKETIDNNFFFKY